MSLDTANTWARCTLRSPAVQKQVQQLFERGAVDGVEATVIAASELTNGARSYLARWTGSELVVLELTARQQHSLGVRPSALFQQLEARSPIPELPAKPWVTLSDITFESGDPHECFQPLTGTCRYAVDDGPTAPLTNCAVRADYFRPDLLRPIMGFSYIDAPPLPPGGQLSFRFSPVSSPKQPAAIRGTLVLFLQLFTAHDWIRHQGCQRISNVTATVVEFGG